MKNENYMECGDQVLRLNALVIHLREQRKSKA
jgi:uncharacterized protein YehS (DUF1456 family)